MTEPDRFRTALALVLLNILALFLVAAPAHGAQIFAYVVGQRDDNPTGNSGIQVISVIDTSTNAVIAKLPAGLSCLCVNPDSIVISPDGRRVYVSNELGHSVSIIDTGTNSVIGTLDVGLTYYPTSLVISPDATRLYVLKSDGGITWVSVFSTHRARRPS